MQLPTLGGLDAIGQLFHVILLAPVIGEIGENGERRQRKSKQTTQKDSQLSAQGPKLEPLSRKSSPKLCPMPFFLLGKPASSRKHPTSPPCWSSVFWFSSSQPRTTATSHPASLKPRTKLARVQSRWVPQLAVWRWKMMKLHGMMWSIWLGGTLFADTTWDILRYHPSVGWSGKCFVCF